MKRAFTLTEILITLTIIGVIATITIPALIHHINKTTTVAKLKVANNMLVQSFSLADSELGASGIIDSSNASTKEWFTERISNHIRLVRTCYDKAGCWHKGTTMLNGSAPYYDKGEQGIGDNNATFITANGFQFNIDGYNSSDLKNKMGINNATDGVVIYIDINGSKKPNIIGKDTFVYVYVIDRGILAAGADKSDSEVKKSCETTGMFCLENIIRDSWSADNVRL